MKDSYPARERNRIMCTSVAESMLRMRRSTDPPCRSSRPNTVSSYCCPAAELPGAISTMATKSNSPDRSFLLGVIIGQKYSTEGAAIPSGVKARHTVIRHVVPGTATRQAPAENVVSLRHAILTAFSRVSGDILYVHQPWGRR